MAQEPTSELETSTQALVGPAAETDAGPRSRLIGTERLCVATRTVKPIARMLRFVVAPDGSVVPDLKRRLPGRGVWVSNSRKALAGVAARGGFARSFRRQVASTSGLVALTEDLLQQAVFDALAIAHKAGLVKTGFAKVETTLANADLLALIHAQEASPDGVRKLTAARRRAVPDRPPPHILVLPGLQLDLALGRSNVIHAGVLAGPASETFIARYRSLEEFREEGPADSGAADD